jgi:hypothetical protein
MHEDREAGMPGGREAGMPGGREAGMLEDREAGMPEGRKAENSNVVRESNMEHSAQIDESTMVKT